MKLTDLHPHWITDEVTGLKMLWFDCPAHPEASEHDWVAIRVSEKPSHQMEVPNASFPTTDDYKVNVWQVTGDSFENLTISPSIDMKGHWHGFITNGQVTNA